MFSCLLMKKIGLICMAKKAESQPMQELIKRLKLYDIDVVIFPEKMILEQPITKWPSNIDIFIAFHSSGYPINKVIEFLRNHKCCINGELYKQRLFFLRSEMKEYLKTHNIPQPEYITLHRQRIFCDSCQKGWDKFYSLYGHKLNPKLNICQCTLQWKAQVNQYFYPLRCDQCKFIDPPNIQVSETFIQNEKFCMSRPFLEKPIDADEHDIHIYFNDCVKRLFRKVKDQCSDMIVGKFPIRQDGCYVYEQFIEAQDLKDVKVYSIYPNYCLCELRKAPHIDGIVERDRKTQKEIRFQTELLESERSLSVLICKIFSQLICGFDILRTQDGRSLIMDVNGFSFVKGNEHYYDMCANILAKMTEREMMRRYMLISGKKVFVEQMYLKQIQEVDITSEDVGRKQIEPLQMEQESKLVLTNEYLHKLNQDLKIDKYNRFKNNNEIKRRALVSVFRHADRTPKIKFKFTSENSELLKIFVAKSNNQLIDYRIKPQNSKDRAIQISQDLQAFLVSKRIIPGQEDQPVNESRHKTSFVNSHLIDLMQHVSPFPSMKLMEEAIVDEYQSISIDENEGIHLMIYLINNEIAGSKIQILSDACDKTDSQFYKAQYIVKWGGYLTVAGLRQAFDAGKFTRSNYVNKNQKVELKIYNTTERRVNRTAEGLLLGFLVQNDKSLDDILPNLKDPPFNMSHFICPDIFNLLTELYGDNTIPNIGYNVQAMKLMISQEDQNISQTSNYKEIKYLQNQQDVAFNKYMNEDTANVKYSYWNKTNASFKTMLKPVLSQLEHDGFHSHFQILQRIDKEFKILIRKIQVQLLETSDIIPLVSYSDNRYRVSECCMSESFPYIYRQFVPTNDSGQTFYNASKLIDIYNWLTFIIVHQKQYSKFPEVMSLYKLVVLYVQRYQMINYGITDFFRKKISDMIARNLLQNIQDDITSAHSFFRTQETTTIQSSIQYHKPPSIQSFRPSVELSKQYEALTDSLQLEHSQSPACNLMDDSRASPQSPQPQINRLHSMYNVAEQSKRVNENKLFETTPQKETEDVFQVKFYVTDEAHICSLYNLLVESGDDEFVPFSTLIKKKQLDTVNYLAQFHFQYFELFDIVEHALHLEQLRNYFIENSQSSCKELPSSLKLGGPSRFLEIYYSNGTSNEVFQLCKNNCLPVDVPELVFSLLPFNNIAQLSKKLITASESAGQFELVSVIGVYRHGDRHPKQKFKVVIKNPLLVDLFIEVMNLNPDQPTDISLNYEKNEYQLTSFIHAFEILLQTRQALINANEYQSIIGLINLLKIKPPALKFQAKFPVPWQGIKQMTLSGKHGGILTDLGIAQAQYCSDTLYQEIEYDCSKQKVSMKEFLSDVDVYTNDEQRVIQTASVVTKSMLDKAGLQFDSSLLQELPILSTINQRARNLMDNEKTLINKALTINRDLVKDYKDLPEDIKEFVTQLDSTQQEDLGNPLEKLVLLRDYLNTLLDLYKDYKHQLAEVPDSQAQQDRLDLSIMLLQEVFNDFSCESNFNVSKVGNVYDLIRYEVLHNSTLSKEILSVLKEAYITTKKLFNFVGPSEYGTNDVNCEIISNTICRDLLAKIEQVSQTSGVKLFFVSESHIQSLVNVFSKQLLHKSNLRFLVEFMSHLLIKIYKNPYNQARMEVYFSVGSTQNPFKYEHGVPRISQPILMTDNQPIALLHQLVENAQRKSELIKIQFELDYQGYH